MRLVVPITAILLLALFYRRHRRGVLIPVLRWPFLVVDLLLALAAPGFNVALDNVALRQQVGVFKQRRPRPFLKRADRLFWVGICGIRHAALEEVVIVKPETIVGWQRPSPTAKAIALPRVGGGHHRYEWLDDDRIAA